MSTYQVKLEYKEDSEDSYECWGELTIYRDGKVIAEHSDRVEPEDNSFYRDWRWIPDAIEQAYRFGIQDGANKNRESTKGE